MPPNSSGLSLDGQHLAPRHDSHFSPCSRCVEPPRRVAIRLLVPPQQLVTAAARTSRDAQPARAGVRRRHGLALRRHRNHAAARPQRVARFDRAELDTADRDPAGRERAAALNLLHGGLGIVTGQSQSAAHDAAGADAVFVESVSRLELQRLGRNFRLLAVDPGDAFEPERLGSL
jgi:hypothetical protein